MNGHARPRDIAIGPLLKCGVVWFCFITMPPMRRSPALTSWTLVRRCGHGILVGLLGVLGDPEVLWERGNGWGLWVNNRATFLGSITPHEWEAIPGGRRHGNRTIFVHRLYAQNVRMYITWKQPFQPNSVTNRLYRWAPVCLNRLGSHLRAQCGGATERFLARRARAGQYVLLPLVYTRDTEIG